MDNDLFLLKLDLNFTVFLDINNDDSVLFDHKIRREEMQLIVKNLKKKFVRNKNKKEKEEFYANNGISFEANEGEIIGILGPNGARKNYTS